MLYIIPDKIYKILEGDGYRYPAAGIITAITNQTHQYIGKTPLSVLLKANLPHSLHLPVFVNTRYHKTTI
jgi:hypothetical protein